jgi:hypothetical protein
VNVVRANLEGVFPTYKLLKDGTRRTYWYHRATLARLHGEPGSAEFIADYAAAEKLIRDRHAGTVNSLIRSYTTSIEFERKLALSTQGEYKRMLTKAEGEFGTMPIHASAKTYSTGAKRSRGHQGSARQTTDICNIGNADLVRRSRDAHR